MKLLSLMLVSTLAFALPQPGEKYNAEEYLPFCFAQADMEEVAHTITTEGKAKGTALFQKKYEAQKCGGYQGAFEVLALLSQFQNGAYEVHVVSIKSFDGKTLYVLYTLENVIPKKET